MLGRGQLAAAYRSGNTAPVDRSLWRSRGRWTWPGWPSLGAAGLPEGHAGPRPGPASLPVPCWTWSVTAKRRGHTSNRPSYCTAWKRQLQLVSNCVTGLWSFIAGVTEGGFIYRITNLIILCDIFMRCLAFGFDSVRSKGYCTLSPYLSLADICTQPEISC